MELFSRCSEGILLYPRWKASLVLKLKIVEGLAPEETIPSLIAEMINLFKSPGVANLTSSFVGCTFISTFCESHLILITAEQYLDLGRKSPNAFFKEKDKPLS